ncbi:protein AIM2 [Staphylotrichum tortipilum]|uniref:Protein AIM2 n=1 Tax=Staphylotrichum tortipilum TaxID=2831512 RepID=A0AAN6MH71_9PEZI|nr:protein AIM2 [Staphylotrichum longicolle]
MQAPMCPDCFTGTLRGDVTPTGTEQTVHGLPTYVALPGDGVAPVGTVVIITDAFGWTLRNTRALADAYAQRVPCTVYVPDFMNGHAIPTSALTQIEAPPPPSTSNPLLRTLRKARHTLPLLPSFLPFILHNHRSAAHPRVLSFLTTLRTASPTTKLGVAGFCWGGLHAVMLTHDAPGNKISVEGEGGKRWVVDCAFTAHPSMLDFPGDVEKVVQPVSVANGEDDEWLGGGRMAKLVGILEAKGKEEGREGWYEAVVYHGAKHGFAVRGDRADPLQRERGEQSEEQAVKWFRRWFTA